MIEKYLVSPLLTLALVITALCWSVTGYAQLNTGKIEGTVKDKDTGAPLAGAQVLIEGTRLGNVTNADGYYFILNVPPGDRSVIFTYTGYQKTTVQNVMVLAGQTLTVNGSLSSTVVELGGITVEAEVEAMMPRDETTTKRRLTAERIAESPATTLDDLIILEPGVQTGGDGALSRGVRIRGGRLGEEAMVVDGVTVRNYTADPFRSGLGWVWEQEEGSLAQDASPLEFSTSSVEQVDIITGGFQAEYGNAQSGIVNIVTKEGGSDWKGNFRFTTDQQNPRTSDYGYNQLMLSVGGPIPLIPNLYIHGSGEIQGQADRTPTHADEGFHAVDQEFVDRLNYAVRNDQVLGSPDWWSKNGFTEPRPVFTLDDFKTGAAFYSSKVGKSAALFSPPNPVRLPENWGDRTLAQSKVTYYPVKPLRLIGSISYSRNQHSYPANDDGNYFQTGWATISTLPDRYWAGDAPDTTVFIPQAFARRTRTTNLLLGADWDFLQTANRSGQAQFRFSRFKTQDISSSSPRDNYIRSENTFMGWSMHDIPFEVETFPHEEVIFTRKVKDQTISYPMYVINLPLEGSENAALYYPDGVGPWHRTWFYETPFHAAYGDDFYWLSYFYQREWQNNYKADVDFQLNRQNRAKTGFTYTTFSNNMFDLQNMSRRRDVGNEFAYGPNMMAFYLQNRTDLGDFVFNYGLRYDRFNPAPDELDNWGFRYGDQWSERYFPKVMSEWSPRFDVAFPVTDKSQLRFSYGVFTQLPSMSFIYSSGNPGDLGYSRTDAFEAGLSYLMTNDMVLDLVAFYRDVEGNVADKEFFRDYYQWHAERWIRDYSGGYANQDNGNIKGLDLTLRRRFTNNFAYNVMYTLQFSRTTGSRYNTTGNWESFLDPTTGETYRPPDEIRPIEGDVTHKLTTNLNYLFPEDFQAGTMANKIMKNVRAYAIFNLQSGPPAYDRVVYGASTYHLNAAENMTWLTRRDGRPIGGINYFRGRWSYNLDFRLTKTFNLGGSRRLGFFGEVFNALNNKLPTPYPSGYSYESYYAGPLGGVDTEWSEGLSQVQKAWFQNDYNGDGVLSTMEAAKGNIARSFMYSTMDKTAWGYARQIRMGVDFTF
ncbi:MAG: carboxypeptidase regulatory-like domain-containing protein [Candidatus Glassbacteria bacterium]|nr:carboxypeptidase regulatory-like domain-containing protein [Candidatus Glassbacteria bacterium]